MNKKTKNRKNEWFVEPIGNVANNLIRTYLNDIGQGSDEIERVEAKDKDGVEHNLLGISYENLRRLIESRKANPDLNFKIWECSLRGDTLYECVYAPEKRNALGEADARHIKRRLAEIKKLAEKRKFLPPPIEPDPFN
jgi:hypothetical protein